MTKHNHNIDALQKQSRIIRRLRNTDNKSQTSRQRKSKGKSKSKKQRINKSKNKTVKAMT